MSFLSSIKQLVGVGGVKASLQIQNLSLPKAGGTVTGSITYTSQSPQRVEAVTVELEEKYTTGTGQQKSSRFFTLGTLTLNAGFDLAAGETKTVPFTFLYTPVKSNNDELKEHGGTLGALGKIGSFVNNEQSVYTVKVKTSVKGSLIGGGAEMKVSLV